MQYQRTTTNGIAALHLGHPNRQSDAITPEEIEYLLDRYEIVDPFGRLQEVAA